MQHGGTEFSVKRTIQPQYDKINNLHLRPSTQSDQSSLCPLRVAKDPRFLHADSEDSNQTGRTPRLVWVFAGRTCHFVGLVVRWHNSGSSSCSLRSHNLIMSNCPPLAPPPPHLPGEREKSGIDGVDESHKNTTILHLLEAHLEYLVQPYYKLIESTSLRVTQYRRTEPSSRRSSNSTHFNTRSVRSGFY